MLASARGALRQPHDSRVVEDADPYSVGADSISARGRFRCRELAREADVRPLHPQHSKIFYNKEKTMPEILKERSELDPQFQWDLTPMFESDAA